MTEEYMNLFGSKKREQARQAAQEQDWQKKYPLTSNAAQQAQDIQQARLELHTLQAEPSHTAGAKRVKDRQISTLNSWIVAMQSNLKDLQVGIAPAVTTSNTTQTYSPASSIIPNAYTATKVSTASTSPLADLSSVLGLSGQQQATAQGQTAASSTPTATNSKKKIIFIGLGILAAGVVVALLVKKHKK